MPPIVGETLPLWQCDKRIKVHQLDVLVFLNLEENTRLFSLFVTDAPYGTQANKTVDPTWDEDMVARVVAGMRRCANHPCTAVIGVGDCMQAVKWMKAFTSNGWAPEHTSRVVTYAAPQRTMCLWVKRQLKQTVHSVHHLYVVAVLGADRTNRVPPRGPFGFFDTTSWLSSSVLSGCPLMSPPNRLLNDQGHVCRTSEKHLGEFIEILSRCFMHTHTHTRTRTPRAHTHTHTQCHTHTHTHIHKVGDGR